MKQLACEMCGGTDLIKQDGVFVCQNCGMKYSVEEAKKLMIEGTVNVANTAQFDNLVKLAKNALESNNNAEAERQANLALAINAADYDTLLIKARAIDGQTNGEKSRMCEAFNCYISAWDILNDDERDNVKDSLFNEIISCINGEIKFWVNKIEEKRPTVTTVNNAINILSEAAEYAKIVCKKLGFPEQSTVSSIYNSFIEDVNVMANSAWESTVAYNYYRESLYDYGKHWYHTADWEDKTDEFRPSQKIWETFANEIEQLIFVMKAALSLKNEKTSYAIIAEIYSNMAFFKDKEKDSMSYSRYSRSTSYGTYYEYWQAKYSWNDNAKLKMSNDIKEWRDLSNKYDALEKEEIKKRIEKYWNEHKEEKIEFLNEKKELEGKIEELKKEIKSLPSNKEAAGIQKQADELVSQKRKLGLLKIKERKVIKEQINVVNDKLEKVKAKFNSESAEIQKKIDPLEKRVAAIQTELTKPR